MHEQQLRPVLAGQHPVQELRLQRLHLSSGKRCVALQLLHRRLQHLQQLSGPVHLLAPLGRQLPERTVGEPLRRLPDADALQGRHRREQARLQPRHGRSGTVHHHGLQLPEHRPAAGTPGDGHVLLQGRRHVQLGLRRPHEVRDAAGRFRLGPLRLLQRQPLRDELLHLRHRAAGLLARRGRGLPRPVLEQVALRHDPWRPDHARQHHPHRRSEPSWPSGERGLPHDAPVPFPGDVRGRPARRDGGRRHGDEERERHQVHHAQLVREGRPGRGRGRRLLHRHGQLRDRFPQHRQRLYGILHGLHRRAGARLVRGGQAHRAHLREERGRQLQDRREREVHPRDR